MTGRPLQQRQIVVADHAGTQQCIVCHNPHSPKFSLSSAEPVAPAGDASGRQTKAAACTGATARGREQMIFPGPSLAGQNAAYFVEALKAYGTGARKNPMMSPVAQGVSEADAGNLAAISRA